MNMHPNTMTIANVYNRNGVLVAKHVMKPADAMCAAVVELNSGNIVHMVNVPDSVLNIPENKPFDHRHSSTLQ